MLEMVSIFPAGQLGVGDHKSYATPCKVKLPADHTPSAVSCGPDCSIIITSSGQLLASGYNKYACMWGRGRACKSCMYMYMCMKNVPIIVNLTILE